MPPRQRAHRSGCHEPTDAATIARLSDGRILILVVEDNHDLRHLFRETLTLAGFFTRGAADGLEALQLIEQDRPDVVVLDLSLPTVDGYAIREEIAANAHTRELPVVVVTGMWVDYGRLYPARVLRKPVVPEELVAAVRASLAGVIEQRRRLARDQA